MKCTTEGGTKLFVFTHYSKHKLLVCAVSYLISMRVRTKGQMECRGFNFSQILASHSVQSHTPTPHQYNELLPAAWVYRGDDLQKDK